MSATSETFLTCLSRDLRHLQKPDVGNAITSVKILSTAMVSTQKPDSRETQSCDHVLARGADTTRLSKADRRGCEGCFDHPVLHWCNPLFAPVQQACGPHTPMHTRLTTLSTSRLLQSCRPLFQHLVRSGPGQFKSRTCLNHFVLIDVCSVEILVACAD